MVLRLVHEKWPLDEVLFVDMGAEFSCNIRNAQKLSAFLSENNVKFSHLLPKHNLFELMLEKDVVKRDGTHQCGYYWCGGCVRHGTNEKLQTLKEHYLTYGNEPVVEYVGIAADETQRINRERQKNSVKLYPLVEWGMKEADCLKYCYESGYDWMENGHDLYELLDRVSCRCCANKNLKELRNIYHYLPDVWQELVSLQDKIPMPYKKGCTVYDLEERFEREDGQLSVFDFI